MAKLHKIRDLCDSRKLSLKELAEKIGLTQSGIQYIFKENNTKVDTLEKIAKALEVPASIFFDDGTPEDLILRLKTLEEEKRILEKDNELNRYKIGENNYLISLYDTFIEHVDNNIIPLLKIEDLAAEQINHIIEYDNIRGAIFDIQEDDNFGSEGQLHKVYQPVYVKYLQNLVDLQKKKIDDLTEKNNNP